MLNNLNIFYKKKFLIYGLGKSGLSAFKIIFCSSKRVSKIKVVSRVGVCIVSSEKEDRLIIIKQIKKKFLINTNLII